MDSSLIHDLAKRLGLLEPDSTPRVFITCKHNCLSAACRGDVLLCREQTGEDVGLTHHGGVHCSQDVGEGGRGEEVEGEREEGGRSNSHSTMQCRRYCC